jgi:putative inorganic carbon (hco3(-)) transporter
MSINELKNKEGREGNRSLYHLLLFYTFIFYSQIGGRVPFIGAVRIELIIGCLILILALFKVKSKDVRIPNNNLNMVAIWFLIVCILTIPFAYYRSYSIDIFFRLLKFFSIYLMLIVGIVSEKQLRGFIWVYILMIAFIFTESFIYAIQGINIHYNSGAMRLFGVTGLFAHPNSLGGVTAANLPFLYFLSKAQKSVVIKLFMLFLILIAIRVVMYTNSRTAFMGVLGFMILFWLYSKRKVVTTGILIASIFVIWLIAPAETKERFLSLEQASSYITNESDGQDAMGNRMILLKHSIDIFLEYPITGVGLGNFYSLSGERYNIWLPTHNLYTQILSETGIIGAIAFFCLIFQIFKNLNRAKRIVHVEGIENTFLSYMLSAVKAFLILRLIIGLFGDDLYENYWWIAGGLSVVLLKLLEHLKTNKEQLRKKESLIVS